MSGRKRNYKNELLKIDAILNEYGPQTPVDVYNILLDSGQLGRYLTVGNIGALKKYYTPIARTTYYNPKGEKGHYQSILYDTRGEE